MYYEDPIPYIINIQVPHMLRKSIKMVYYDECNFLVVMQMCLDEVIILVNESLLECHQLQISLSYF